ncbi:MULTISPECIES: TDT family transporter [unclassified Rhizobium]|uniref:TDT family transporter n=1 Tax=unclassified Rhizobium TaxID=2613769 RepID=UPI0006F4B21C|nr:MULTISPECIES: TDT family transporter [unclassified Rhizobium]KQV38353.1 C4-dicarboxylate ABC transporter [Rhizobium sp. Root1212]KRD31008.1 C4-dicarboxylate ABC transporter [Rhizobium sp. Root268]
MSIHIALPHQTRTHGRTARNIRHFTPNWFAASMGTGAMSLVLGQFPSLPVASMLGEGLFVLNGLLFFCLTLAYAAKWVCFPRDALRLFDHPVASMFLGCIPMAFATVINGAVLYLVPKGLIAAEVVARFWWSDVLLALGIGLMVPFMMFTRQEHAIERMSAVWLLPVVAAEVVAASGALLLPHLSSGSEQLSVLLASYVLWSCSVPLALGILVILFLRLVLHKLPPVSMAATSWLALGPLGTGALALILFSANGTPVLEAAGLGPLAPAMAGASLMGAFLLWGYGIWWFCVAVLVTIRHLREGLSFDLSWWGYTFPLGVFTLATLKLAGLFPVRGLEIFADGLAVALAAIWLVVAGKTIHGAWSGKLFHDPSLGEGA